MRPQRSRTFFTALRIFSLLLLLAAGALAYQQWQSFQQVRRLYPPGSTIGGVPVGGLDRQQARQHLVEAYSTPIELRYDGAPIQLTPEEAGFELDLERMVPAEASSARPAYLWPDFSRYLAGSSPTPLEVPLAYTIDESRLRAALQDLAARYDRPPTPARPVPARTIFEPGSPGTALDMDESLRRIQQVLPGLHRPPVELAIRQLPPARPSLQNLEILLRQIATVSGLDALVGVYLFDLQTGEQAHFALRRGEELAVQPDVAFTASSIIKIPIMLSAFRRMESSPGELAQGWLFQMFSKSSNEAADALMRNGIDEVRGPLVVTEDLQALGFKNTFLAGYFTPGSPLLQIFETPANRRQDVDTAPDIYNQTTPSEIGRLLVEIYRCAQSGSGLLVETFDGEITQDECRQMVEYMKEDRQPYLIKAGIPEGTPVAHKHGYGASDTIGDAGIVYTPGGDYVLVIFLHHPELLAPDPQAPGARGWEPSNQLIARLSQAVYNYFNLDQR